MKIKLNRTEWVESVTMQEEFLAVRIMDGETQKIRAEHLLREESPLELQCLWATAFVAQEAVLGILFRKVIRGAE